MKISDVIRSMVSYEDGNIHNVSHAMKVYAYAETIAEAQGIDGKEKEILEIAAVLHDIGIKNSILKYGSSAGKYQEKEGPAVVRELLSPFELPEQEIERICWLISHHHSYGEIDGIDHQILIEADFLVNIEEERMSGDTISHIREKIFRTQMGKELLEKIYPLRSGVLSREEERLLVKEAFAAREKAYAPYSKFAVGAALLSQAGHIYRGCNIESSSYSPTNCAERTAIFKAVSEGERSFRAIAIVGGPLENPIDSYCPPCGVCRQVMQEFCPPDFPIYLASSPEQYRIYTLSDLLPCPF